MTPADSEDSVKIILLDIEGTTTSVSFVYGVLFPFARRNLKDFLLARIDDADVRRQMELLESERSDDLLKGVVPPAFASGTPESLVDPVVSYANWLMDLDRKSTPLKSIQGMIWESGYRSGELKGHVYEDVPRAMKRWRQQGRAIYIYSSGSVLAQKLLFAHSESGDLCKYIDGHFDTLIGPKRDPDSYRKISQRLEQDPKRILFVSDVTQELDSALAAGMRVVLAIRDGDLNQRDQGECQAIRSFDELFA
jgi:enolase-phosphatase E1